MSDGLDAEALRLLRAHAPELEVEGRTTDDVLSAILDRIRVPE